MTTLPGHKAEGSFDFTDQDGQVYNLPVARATFNLYRPVPTWPEGALTLGIMIMVEPREVPSDGATPVRVDPCLDTQWLTISEKDLKSKTRDMLDGYSLDHDDGGDWSIQNPACLYQDSYGGVGSMTLSLAYEADGYRIRTQGHDEFKRSFKIDARIGLFDVTVRHDDRTQNPDADAWLAQHFDTDQMQAGWVKKGPSDAGWNDLDARWL